LGGAWENQTCLSGLNSLLGILKNGLDKHTYKGEYEDFSQNRVRAKTIKLLWIGMNAAE